MTKASVTGVTVSHIWDDDSQTDYDIRRASNGDLGPYVSITQAGDIISIQQESWPEIRDQIESMFYEFDLEAKDGD